MTTPDERHNDLRDDELSRRYRALAPELPHPDTDAAIRAAAREALTVTPRRHQHLAMYGGLAMAASVTLMVAILLPSWRSGELREELAVRAPAEMAATGPATERVAPAGRESLASASGESVAEPSLAMDAEEAPVPVMPRKLLASPSPVAALSHPDDAGVDADAMALQRQAAPAASVPTSGAEAGVAREAALPASPLAGASPAPAMPSPRLSKSGADMASGEVRTEEDRALAREEQKMQSVARAKRERMTLQQTEAARSMAATPLAEEVLPLEALLQAERYGEALALLQGDGMAGDASLDSRRDLLRQLVPGQDKTLTCRPEGGPAAARALCTLLSGYQAGRGVPAAARDALRQALQAEGVNPAPWLQAVSRLP